MDCDEGSGVTSRTRTWGGEEVPKGVVVLHWVRRQSLTSGGDRSKNRKLPYRVDLTDGKFIADDGNKIEITEITLFT
jgi:hypothetical protein